METGSILDATQEQLTSAGTKLACTVQLIVQLIRHVIGGHQRTIRHKYAIMLCLNLNLTFPPDV